VTTRGRRASPGTETGPPGRPTGAAAEARSTGTELRPAEFCRQLLLAADASEGRQRRRNRDTTPDAIGMAIKRGLLAGAVGGDPDPDDFEGWLVRQCLAAGPGSGAVRAMAITIFEEWRLAKASSSLGQWLARGAPSDDAQP